MLLPLAVLVFVAALAIAYYALKQVGAQHRMNDGPFRQAMRHTKAMAEQERNKGSTNERHD